MKQNFSKSSFAVNVSKRLSMGVISCLLASQVATAQTESKPSIVSSVTESGITTTTYSNGKIVKTVADGYHLDTAFYKNSNVVMSTKAKQYWKITDRIGVATPFCKEGEDITMFLKPGAYNYLTVNHFWGKIGLGILGGYQNFGVSDDYKGPQGLIARNAATKGIPTSALTYDKVGSYEDFLLMIGPAVSLPLGTKFSLDIDAKGGLMNTSAPRFGATIPGNLGADQVIFRLNPSASKNQLGGVLSVDLLYNLSKTWSLGLNAVGFVTKTPFTTVGQDVTPGSNILLTKEDTRTHGGCNFGLALAHTFGACNAQTVYELLPPPPAPVVCAVPTLESESGRMYDYGSTEKPTFRWKSTSGTPENEEYIFKLYKADGSGIPVYQQTTKSTTLNLPNNVSLVNGDECSFYYYTIQSSVQGKCLSEANAASFGYKAKPAPIAPVVKTDDQYIFKIFGGSTATKYFGTGKPVRKPRKIAKAATPATATATPAKKLIPRRKKASAGTATGVKKYSTVVNYENVATNPNIKWPEDLPLPKSPAVYEYEVQRLSAGDCKPTGQVAKYKFYIDPKKPNDIRIIPDSPKRK
jgi:hypothetical protein